MLDYPTLIGLGGGQARAGIPHGLKDWVWWLPP